jgi:hypothetical protein
MAQFEDLMADRSVVEAARVLSEKKGSGAILRNLNYILSRCKSYAEVDRVVKLVNSVKGKELATLDVIKYISKQIPDKVTEAFYRGFPESVRKLTREELLFDQLLHYFDTYVCGNFEGEAAHSLFEENFEREAFTEKTTIKNFDILTEEDAMKVLLEMANNLLQSSRPLSVGAYDLIKELALDKKLIVTDGIASRDTAIKLLLDLNDAKFAQYLNLSDILKVVEEMLKKSYPRMTLKKLNLKNQDRKFIATMLDYKMNKVSSFQKALCFERRADWKGLLHHIQKNKKYLKK